MKVEIWSDIVCPWCYIGKRRWEKAVEAFGEGVDVTWRSFELDPGAPREPNYPLDEALARKYGTSIEGARQMMDRVTDAAREEGLEFDFSEARGGNTFDAHRLLQFAKGEGRGDALKERLLRAYFTEGVPVHDHDALLECAVEVGLDRDAASSVLADGSFGAEVRQDQARAMELGVRGVPFFVVEEKYGVSGAQTPETFLQVLEKAAAESRLERVEGDDACGPGGCAV